MGETGNENILTIEHLDKEFTVDNEIVKVVSDVNLNVKEGEFISIVGPSGCGKSTLFRIIGGLETATDGIVRNKERCIDGISKNIGMVFQESRLFPWLKIRDNVAFGISREEKKETGRKTEEIVDYYLDLVDLRDFANAYPNQLSGGMQQRVSIARTLIENPEILLLDEPFSALDAFTRMSLQGELLRIWERAGKTMILVTHDIDEAIFLSDRVIVLTERPATVKKEFRITLDRPRDRSSIEFMNIRRKIMMEFFDRKDAAIEYFI